MLKRHFPWYLKQRDPFETLWRRTVHHEIIFIKSNPICANNNPKLQNFFKMSEVASRRKTFSVVGKSSILDLIEFLDLPLLNYIATTLHYSSQQTGLQEKHDIVEDYK